MSIKKLAIITTHPIQYNAPFFKLLADRGVIEIKVFYTWGDGVLKNKYDPGFGKVINWDIPLLEGYQYEFVKNISKNPGSHNFKGIDNPGLLLKIKGWNPDALMVYGWNFKSHLKALRYFKGKIPIIFRGDSTLLQKRNGIKSLLRKIFLKWVYSHVSYAMYVGTLNKSYYQKFGLKEKNLFFGPHAIDNKRFGLNIEERRKWRKKLGISENDILLLYAGKIDENKNVAFLARNFTSMKLEGVKLLIAGNGPSEIQLKDEFNGVSNIIFIDFQNQSNMPALYSMADIFILPSLSETWGLAINEAMAAGKAVLVSKNCGAAVDLVTNGINGYTFDPAIDTDLKEKILLMTSDKEKLDEMGNASLNIIKNWSYEVNCDALERIVNSTKVIQ